MAWKSSLGKNRRRFCTETATWLEQNRGWEFRAAFDLTYANYGQMAQWLGEGRTAEWCALELLAQQVTEASEMDNAKDGAW